MHTPSFPNATDLILVCLLKAPRDLEIARVLGWYRIPLRSAPKVIAVDYLAFYQTAAFGEERWRINYYAQVRGYELLTRAELLRDEVDHPSAQQEYFKIQLGPLQRLSQPILAEKWRRITFFYTTGEYFNKAKVIKDLLVPEDERMVLWQSLRERASQREAYLTPKVDEIDLPAETLAALLGLSSADKAYHEQKRA